MDTAQRAMLLLVGKAAINTAAFARLKTAYETNRGIR